MALYIILFFFKCSELYLSSSDSSLLISDFEAQPASPEVATEDDFDPIPVTGQKNSQGTPLKFFILRKPYVAEVIFEIKHKNLMGQIKT